MPRILLANRNEGAHASGRMLPPCAPALPALAEPLAPSVPGMGCQGGQGWA